MISNLTEQQRRPEFSGRFFVLLTVGCQNGTKIEKIKKTIANFSVLVYNKSNNKFKLKTGYERRRKYDIGLTEADAA